MSKPQDGVPANTPVSTKADAMDVVPFNAALEDAARDHWIAGQWRELSQLPQSAQEHPDRGRLLVLGAAACLQLGDVRAARRQVQMAMEAGCDKRFLRGVLLASAYNTLARASMAAGREEQAMRHFERSLFDARMSSESRRMAQARASQINSELRMQRHLGALRRKAGMPAGVRQGQDWLQELRGRCLAADDLHDAVDDALDSLQSLPEERIRFLILIADHFLALSDKGTAVHYLNLATEFAQEAAQPLRAELAQRLVAAGYASVAMDVLVADTIGNADQAIAPALKAAYEKSREAERSRTEHGHELLLAYLKIYLPTLRDAIEGRPLEMVEIGTTRENVPGQGSTRKLAEFCKANAIRFTTVDMDPHNSRNASAMFAQLQCDFEAIAAKGEDYLRERQAPVDLLFLDAYDFDHGKHSEMRQSRYRKFLGAQIDEKACHQMHLDCAESAVRLVSGPGLVCIDDTWIEQDAWTAKGATAMPFLLANGFELIEARNHAALMRRAP